ncbi:MAG: lytic transglycosylase domain-containing protein, partial [Bacteroidaceae bacterium]|nr:lytic transglycosylase domain-containing protein [Bacteroidaceae bacterium]
MIKKVLFAILLPTCIYIALSAVQSNKSNKPESQIPYCVISPDVPTAITFAGEDIDLATQDRRERMDREILAFTYSHINTMLQIKRANRLFPVIEPIL